MAKIINLSRYRKVKVLKTEPNSNNAFVALFIYFSSEIYSIIG